MHVLLVEDDPADVRLTVEGLKEGSVPCELHVVGDGDEALAFLRREGKHRQSVRPDVVLLDLKLPGTSGLEVLEAVKSDPDLKQIPVIVLTTSRARPDIVQSYLRHANCVVTKPSDVREYLEIVKLIEGFWISTVRLPTGKPGEEPSPPPGTP